MRRGRPCQNSISDGSHAIATPPLGPFNRAALVLAREVIPQLLEHFTILDHAALGRRQRGELATAFARGPVLVALRSRQLFGDTNHANLAGQLVPGEAERDVRIAGDLATFATEVVAEEDVSVVHAPQQHLPGGRMAVGIDRGHHHRLGFVQSRIDHLGMPPPELLQRIGVEVGSSQPAFEERLPRVVEVHRPSMAAR